MHALPIVRPPRSRNSLRQAFLHSTYLPLWCNPVVTLRGIMALAFRGGLLAGRRLPLATRPRQHSPWPALGRPSPLQVGFLLPLT